LCNIIRESRLRIQIEIRHNEEKIEDISVVDYRCRATSTMCSGKAGAAQLLLNVNFSSVIENA